MRNWFYTARQMQASTINLGHQLWFSSQITGKCPQSESECSRRVRRLLRRVPKHRFDHFTNEYKEVAIINIMIFNLGIDNSDDNEWPSRIKSPMTTTLILSYFITLLIPVRWGHAPYISSPRGFSQCKFKKNHPHKIWNFDVCSSWKIMNLCNLIFSLCGWWKDDEFWIALCGRNLYTWAEYILTKPLFLESSVIWVKEVLMPTNTFWQHTNRIQNGRRRNYTSVSCQAASSIG